MARLVAFIDWFLPPHIRSGESDELRRARLTVAFGWALLFAGSVYSAVYYAFGSPASAGAIAAAVAVGIVLLYVMRRTGSSFVMGNLMTMALFIPLTFSACRLGGHGAPVLSWYVLVPVLALVTAGRRAMVFWFIIALLSQTTLYTLGICGFVLPSDLTPRANALVELIALAGLGGVVLALAVLYEAARRQAQAELRSAEEQLRHEKDFSDSVIASLPGVFYLFDGEKRFLRWNEEFERVTGYSREELSEMQPLDFFQGEDRDAVEKGIRDVFVNGQNTVEACFSTKQGNPTAFVLNGRRITINGKLHFIGTGIDITERRQIQEALERRLVALTRPLEQTEILALDDLFNLQDIQRLQDEFANATGVASIITHTNGTPATAPSNFCRLCRDIIRKTEKGCAKCFKSDAELGRFNPDGPTVKPCLSAGLWYAGASISVGGRHIANWLVGQVRDGTQTEDTMRAYAREIGADEDAAAEAFREVPTMSRERFEYVAQALYTLARQLSNMAYQNVQQARFITDRERIERELARARDAAEAATQAKSEFLANMSHEIRTPMTAVLGFSDVLLESSMNGAQRDAVATIKRNGEYLIRILNDILDLSKIEAGKLDIELVPCSPCEILSEVAALMRIRASSKNLPLEIEFDGPLPSRIRSDPTRLRQVLINLIGNAVKFTDAGSVRLVTRLLNADSNDPSWQVEVIDSGIGMSNEQTAKLFKPFSQVDSSSTRRYGGTGLGLAISARLAESLGGNIAVCSRLGKGSTFVLTVKTGSLDGVMLLDDPALELPSDDTSYATSTSSPGRNCRVLLAEDGPDNQRLITFLLRREGCRVAMADNGRVAYDLALQSRDKAAPFDLILMDMQMPVMDGYEATRRLREAGYSGPIVALTAHAMQTDRQRCLQAGCDDYMAKPVDRKKLIELVSRYARAETSPDTAR